MINIKKTKTIMNIFLIAALVFFVIFTITKKVNNIDKNYESFSKPLQKKGCIGLNYHRIRKDNIIIKLIERLTISDELKFFSIYEDEFEYHIKTLVENNAVFITPAEIEYYIDKGAFPKNCVWISFDDMDISIYENAFPILKKYNVPFTSYIIAGQVGAKDFNNLEIASWDQIQEMVDSGLMTVGSHSYNMHILENDEAVFFNPKLKNEFFLDLVLSKQTLETNLEGVEVLDYAYPYGDGKSELVTLIKKAGFESSALLSPYIIDEDSSIFWINRLVVDHSVFKKVIEPWLK